VEPLKKNVKRSRLEQKCLCARGVAIKEKKLPFGTKFTTIVKLCCTTLCAMRADTRDRKFFTLSLNFSLCKSVSGNIRCFHSDSISTYVLY
jgi:hypothetical protein